MCVCVRQCQLGVLPLGTGNDLARVLGWGGLCDDDAQLLQILEKLERATTKMLDRWSVMTYEVPATAKGAPAKDDDGLDSPLQVLPVSISNQLFRIQVSICGTCVPLAGPHHPVR